MEDLKDILSESNKDIDNQKIMDYLSDKLSGLDKYNVEKEMADSEFINDAVEGLENLKNKKDINVFVDQLNNDLHKQLNKKRERKLNRRLKDTPWLYVAIILIIFLIIISFIVIKKHLDTDTQLKKMEQVEKTISLKERV